MTLAITMSALGLLLLVGAQGTTIISIKYPPQGSADTTTAAQPAKRDLSLSYAATNIDSKEGTRVKTITVIKNVGGVGESGSSGAASNRQVKLAINPELHKNEEWATAFRDNFESYGGLPDVPDIDDLFDFVNGKKTTAAPEKDTKKEHKPTESTTKSPPTTKATSEHAEDAEDSDEATVEKIKGDAELLPHIKQANILRLQALAIRQQQQQQQQQQPQQQHHQHHHHHSQQHYAEDPDKRLHTRESPANTNYSTPLHSMSQYFEKYVQVLPNGYDYTKPQQPCAVPAPPNSIQVTTPSGRTYDIPQSNSSGTNGGANHPYLAPSLAKRTQLQPGGSGTSQPQPQPQPQQPPNFSTVNSIVPPIVQPQQGNSNIPANVPQQPTQSPQSPNAGAGAGTIGRGSGGGAGPSTSQRPYVAPSLRNNGLGINRGPPTPQPPSLPTYSTGNANGGSSYRTNSFGANRPNTYRSRGLKY